MKKTGRGGPLMLAIAVTVCIAWLSLAWSPTVEVPPAATEIAEPAPAPAAPASVAQPVEPAAPAPSKPALEQEPPTPAQPERLPTPHPMSLDQTKPPEQYGALSELKKQYESESRAAESSETEARLRALISTPNVPAELVQTITCRRSLCKIEAQWTPRRRIGFAVLLESFKQLYSQRVAVEPAAAQSADGSYQTTLYMRLTP